MKKILALSIAALACSAAAAQSNAPVRIGVPAIQSGSMAQYGLNFTNGVTTAINELNAAGGITIDGQKYPVEAVFCDTQADTAKAAACGRRLASQNKVAAMAIATSIETFPILSFNTNSRPPFLVVSSSASNKLVHSENPLVARYWYNTYSYMPYLVEAFSAMYEKEGKTLPTLAFMQSEDEFGKAWVDTFGESWRKAGGKTTSHSTWVIGTTDFYPQLTSLLRDKPELIGVPGACGAIAPILRQARELGFEGHFVIDMACDAKELTAFLKDDVFKGSFFFGTRWNLDTPEVTNFRTQYQAVSKDEPTVISADGYGQAMWIFKSMEHAGTAKDAARIRDAMATTLEQSWNILGIQDLQPNGETSATVFPRQYLAADNIVNWNK